ncbi:MAG TPA: amidase [Thermoanaerobaculia bacterium]|nr:amidase [Thermoanaerobaculia bacterium]
MSELDRLEALFAAREPEVHAFLPEEGRFERLRREEGALLDRWPDPARRPPLFGVPVGVKDIYRVDGFPTRAGSRLPPEELKGPEAASVTILREAGALILGKTVSTEFAFFAPGPTRNPWNSEHTPGGSSSGSAAAVGAGLCPLALGTQTIGSILRPAAFCGAVGFKPSYERISREGVIPLAPSLDHMGFFTPDVAGAARAAAVLCRDWHAVKPGKKPRLGVAEGPYLERASGEGLVHFRQVCHRLVDAGFEVLHVPALPDFGEIAERHFRITAAEAARVHRDWFARFGDLYAPKTVELIRRGQSVTDDELERDLDGREELRDVLTGLMDDHRLDLWLSPPALGAAPRGLDSTGDPVMNIPWSQAGMPAICLPAGRNAAGLPFGVQVAARWWADEALLAWAGDLETALQP